MIETGVLFDNIHSFRDLNLILSAVDIPPAKPKTTYVDVPGADGSVDLTEANGEVKFSDRNIKFTFTMNPMGDLSEAAWTAKMTEVSNRLNGQRFKITLDKDFNFYWLGRCTVDSYKSNKKVRQIVVTAKVSPYKLKRSETKLTFKLTSSPKKFNIVNARKSVCPVIECTGSAKITFGAATISINAGMGYKFLDIVLVEGNNQLEISGSGTVTFRFQEGEL